MFGPIARIILRYGVGAVAGAAIGTQLSLDADVVAVLAAVIAGVAGYVVEKRYQQAKRNGEPT